MSIDIYLQNEIRNHEKRFAKTCLDLKLSVKEVMQDLMRGKKIPTELMQDILVLDTLKKTWNREKYIDENTVKFYTSQIVEELKTWGNQVKQSDLENLKAHFKTVVDHSKPPPDTEAIKTSLFSQLLQVFVLKDIYGTELSGVSEQPPTEDTSEPPPEVA